MWVEPLSLLFGTILSTILRIHNNIESRGKLNSRCCINCACTINRWFLDLKCGLVLLKSTKFNYRLGIQFKLQHFIQIWSKFNYLLLYLVPVKTEKFHQFHTTYWEMWEVEKLKLWKGSKGSFKLEFRKLEKNSMWKMFFESKNLMSCIIQFWKKSASYE